MRRSTSILSAAALALGTVTLSAVGASAADPPSATIQGSVGENVSTTDPYDGRYLRYVGNPPPEGANEYYQWGSPAVTTTSPEDGPITISGTLDLSGLSEKGQVTVIGLSDAEMLTAGDRGEKTQDGIYVAYTGPDTYVLGLTDGDAGGGEFVQSFQTFTSADLGDLTAVDVTLVVDGTADPATCASDTADVATADGCMTLDVNGSPVANDSYGSIVPVHDPNDTDVTAYDASDELAQGAVPGWYSAYDSVGPEVGVSFDLNVSPVVPADTDGDDGDDGAGHGLGVIVRVFAGIDLGSLLTSLLGGLWF